MKLTLTLILGMLLCTGLAWADTPPVGTYYFSRDLIFPQVAAGGLAPNPNYETWITVTNRGTAAFTGNIYFFTSAGTAWNPYVNGSSITGGMLPISIQPRTVMTYKVTLPGATEAGYAIVSQLENLLTSFIEGNATYYVDSTADSVGVPPGRTFVNASLPFENFETICLALANPDFSSTANVTFRLYSKDNVLMDTKHFDMLKMTQSPRYLWEIFNTTPRSFGRGRVEILATSLIVGVAVTQTEAGQMSSLPLGASTGTYSITTGSFVGSGLSNFFITDLTLWNEETFLDGFARIGINGVYKVYPVYGGYNEQPFDLYAVDSDNSVILMATFIGTSFSFGQVTFSGRIYIYSTQTKTTLGYKPYTATLVEN
jgi:hypothetical protein